MIVAVAGLLAGSRLVLSQCSFSPLEPGPSAIAAHPPRKLFPVAGPQGAVRYIDRTGKLVPAPAPETGFQPFKEFVDGHPRYGFRDNAGTVRIAPQFLDAGRFAEQMAPVKDASGNWGFIDESGKLRIPAKFHEAGEFHDGMAAVDLCDKCGYIDREGKLPVSAGFRHCYRFDEGVAKVEISEGKWGFIDKSGKVLATLSNGGEWQLYSAGLMPSERPGGGGGIGFVNRSGEFVIPPRFAFVQPFSEGLAAVKENNRWGYIDSTGRYAIPPQFGDPEDPRGGLFQEGMAFVTDPKTGLHAFIDKTGKYVIPPRFRRCEDPSGEHCGFDGGLAWVETSTLEGYINPQGGFVWSTPVGRGRN